MDFPRATLLFSMTSFVGTGSISMQAARQLFIFAMGGQSLHLMGPGLGGPFPSELSLQPAQEYREQELPLASSLPVSREAVSSKDISDLEGTGQ